MSVRNEALAMMTPPVELPAYVRRRDRRMISLFCVPIISRGVRARYAQTIPDDGRAARQSGLRNRPDVCAIFVRFTRSVVAQTALPYHPGPFLDLRCNVASQLRPCH